MPNHEDTILDEWEIKLEEKIVELKSCQDSNNLKLVLIVISF